MSARKQTTSGWLSLIAWTFLGVIVGAGASFFVYAKQFPVFRSTAVIQVNRPVDVGGEVESQGQVAAELPGEGSENEPQAEGQKRPPTGPERWVLLSEPVISAALGRQELRGLPELEGDEPPPLHDGVSLARWLVRTSAVTVDYEGESLSGQIYRLHALGKTPSSAMQINQAILSSYLRHTLGEAMAGPDADFALASNEEGVANTIELVLQRIGDLEQKKLALTLPQDAALEAGRVVSPAAEDLIRYRRLTDERAAQAAALEQKLRTVEALITQGAGADNVLFALGQSVPSHSPASGSETFGMRNQSSQMAFDVELASYQQRMAERKRVIAEIEREVQPLETEKEELLKHVGPAHPRVKGVQRRIDTVRRKLDNLPPVGLPPAQLSQAPSDKAPDDDAAEAELRIEGEIVRRPRSKGETITALLRALRSEVHQATRDIDAAAQKRDAAASSVAVQQRILLQNQQLNEEIQQQKRLLAGITQKLTPAADQGEHSVSVSVSVLESPELGVQIAPVLEKHLFAGGLLGGFSGFSLGILLLMGSLAAAREQETS